MKIFQIWGDYVMEVYAARTAEEAWRLFMAKNAFRFDDEPITIDDLSYPWDGCTPSSMKEIDISRPGYLTGYIE